MSATDNGKAAREAYLKMCADHEADKAAAYAAEQALRSLPWQVQGQLPQVPESEKALLSLMHTHPDAVMQAGMLEGLNAACFYIPAHAIIWDVMAARYTAGRPAGDVEGLLSELSLSGQIQKIGGQVGLFEVLFTSRSSLLHLQERLGEVMRAYRARTFILRAQRAAAAVYAGEAPQDQLHLLEEGKASATPLLPFTAALDKALAELEAAVKRQGVRGVCSGYAELDRMLDGFVPGRYYVIGARSGMGKTALMLNLALHAATTEEPEHPGTVLVLTGEMPPQDLSLRLLAIEAEECATFPPDMNKLIQREKKKKLAAAAGRLQNAPVQFLEVAGWTVEKVVATVRAISRTMPLKMVLLDYLQLLKSAAATEAGSDRVGEVAAVSNALRDFAHASSFPLLVLAQINRQYAKEAQKKPETLPTVADLKGSGDIEQDADAVLLLHRPEKCLPQNATPMKKAELAGKAYISVDKNRHGEGGVVALKWRGYCQKFEESGEQ